MNLWNCLDSKNKKTLINLADTSALRGKYYLSSRPERWRMANALLEGKFLQRSAAAHFPPSVKDAGNLTPQLCFWKAQSIEITCSGSCCSTRSSLFWKLTGPRCFWPDSRLQWNTHRCFTLLIAPLTTPLKKKKKKESLCESGGGGGCGRGQSKLKFSYLGFTLPFSCADGELGAHRSADRSGEAPRSQRSRPLPCESVILPGGNIKAAGSPHWRWLSWTTKAVPTLAHPTPPSHILRFELAWAQGGIISKEIMAVR